MIVYMLRDRRAGKWYKRGPRACGNWVKQEKASAWTTKQGAASAKGSCKSTDHLDIVPFQLVSLEKPYEDPCIT